MNREVIRIQLNNDMVYEVTHSPEGDIIVSVCMDEEIVRQEMMGEQDFLDCLQGTGKNLSAEVRGEVFREELLNSRKEDVLRHLEDEFPDIAYTENDLECLAEQFLEDYDCNLSENDQIEEVIKNYFYLSNH